MIRRLVPALLVPLCVIASVLAAGLGVLVRARWAGFAAAVAAFALVESLAEIWGLTWRLGAEAELRTIYLGTLMIGVATAAACAVVAWRTARSSLGSLRYFAS